LSGNCADNLLAQVTATNTHTHCLIDLLKNKTVRACLTVDAHYTHLEHLGNRNLIKFNLIIANHKQISIFFDLL